MVVVEVEVVVVEEFVFDLVRIHGSDGEKDEDDDDDDDDDDKDDKEFALTPSSPHHTNF